MELKESIQHIEEELIAFRRLLHQNPELSHREKNTSAAICHCLARHGIAYEAGVGDYGVVAVIPGGQEGKTVAIRADMDALPVTEDNELPFCSVNKGVMHACGHDAHTAILMGSALVLHGMAEELKGTVKCFFQPGEEDLGGAEAMIAQGCLEHPTVSHVIGLHVQPHLPAGTVEIKRGKLNGNSGGLRLTVKGQQGHGAAPHTAVDAVVIAAHVITALQTLVSRNTDPVDATVLTFGAIHGGKKANIIAHEVVIEGTLRTLDAPARIRAKDLITRIATHTAQALGGEAEITFEDGYIALINDDQVMDVIEAVATAHLGCGCVGYKEAPSLGGEDFAFFAQAVPSGFFHLGCGGNGSDSLHSASFLLDERCLALGVELEVATVLRLLDL